MSRYLTNLTIALLGGLVVVASTTFTAPATAWLAFGVAIAVLTISILAQLDTHRGLGQRALDGVLAAISVILIVFSIIFGGAAVTWLAFSLSLGFVAGAVVGMTWYEIENWRSTNGLGELHLLVRTQPAPLDAPKMAGAA
jgi:O-antigen/teichoic acid export membrane protein